jgi:hypothetical protein
VRCPRSVRRGECARAPVRRRRPNERWVGGANEILYSGAMEARSETGLASVRRPLASMQHVSDRCERQSQHGARKVDVMPEAVRLAETHRWEQAKRFSDMCEDNDEQATGSKDLQTRRQALASQIYDDGVGEPRGHR